MGGGEGNEDTREMAPIAWPFSLLGDFPDTIQCADVQLVSRKECERAYPGKITQNMVCAGDKKEGNDSCQVSVGAEVKSTANRKTETQTKRSGAEVEKASWEGTGGQDRGRDFISHKQRWIKKKQASLGLRGRLSPSNTEDLS